MMLLLLRFKLFKLLLVMKLSIILVFQLLLKPVFIA
jgi:hypothetical protein